MKKISSRVAMAVAAVINATVHNSGKMFLVYNKLTYHAEATVIEFDE